MGSKRSAAKELNSDNWDEVEEPEEMGTYRLLSDNEHNRVIRTAKRRSNITSNDEVKKGLFSNFSGFGKSTSTSKNSFDFLTNISNGKSESIKTEETKLPIPPKETVKASETSKVEEKKATVANNNHSDEYCSNLKSLNQSVYEWIKSHIEKNPYCILTPIFDDYKKYLKDFDKYKTEPTTNTNNNEKSEVKALDLLGDKNKESISSNTQFPMTHTSLTDKSKESKEDTLGLNKKPDSTFSQVFSSTPVSKAPIFSFGQQSSSTVTTSSSNFSFGGGKPFSFGNIAQVEKKSESKPIDENEEDEEPPKVTFTPVVEEDSIYSKRCKVFVKNDGSFGDRGVGTLYLKPISGSEKHQLIVRADTSLGNLLINMVLSASIPTSRMGKNNVMLVTIPTPDAKPPPVPLLLRVKTSQEADELLATLNKYKK